MIRTPKEGVEKLLAIRGWEIPDFSIRKPEAGRFLDRLSVGGKTVPIFTSRCEPRLRRIAVYAENSEVVSALNVYSYVGSDVPLRELLFRELDFAEFILHARIASVTAFVNKGAVNLIAALTNGTRANIDLGNTMAPGTECQCQHRLLTSRGMANDRPVGEMRTGSQVYVFGSENREPQTYDDDEYYLYGLSPKDVTTAITVHAMLTDQLDYSGFQALETHLLKVVDAVFESSCKRETVKISDEKEENV